MDARRKQTFPALLAGCGLMFAAAINADADVRIHAYADQHIRFSGDDVIITADDASEARISPAGDLRIAGKTVAVSADQRRLLVQYSAGAHGIASQGAKVGSEGAKMAVTVLDDVFSGIFDGDVKETVEARVKAHTAGLKSAVRTLCDDMRSLQSVQDRLVGSLSNFRPYAVITDQYIGHCYDGINHADED